MCRASYVAPFTGVPRVPVYFIKRQANKKKKKEKKEKRKNERKKERKEKIKKDPSSLYSCHAESSSSGISLFAVPPALCAREIVETFGSLLNVPETKINIPRALLSGKLRNARSA